MKTRRILAGLAAPLVLLPAGYGYIRSTVTYGDGTVVAIRRGDAPGIQPYINSRIGPNTVSSAIGIPVTVISPSSDPVAATRSALAAWNAVPGTSIRFLPLKTTDKVNDPNDRQMTLSVGATAADLSALGYVAGVTTGAVALTVPTPASFTAGTTPTGELTDSDIILNPSVKFSTDGSTSVDLQAVLTHELGHALGANHSVLVGATMFQYASLNQRILSQDEMAFARAIYPATGVNPGTLSGKVVAADGSPVQAGLVTMIDTSTGSALSALTDQDGTYSVQAPPGSYIICTEPMGPNSVVQPGNLYLTTATKVTTNFQATVLGGVGSPTKVTVTDGAMANAPNLTVPAGASPIQLPYLGVGAAGVSGDVRNVTTQAPVVVSSGKAVDLAMIGGGVDGTVSVHVFGRGVTVRAGSVRVDSNISFGGSLAGQPMVRVTLDVAAQQNATLASVFITKGTNTFVLSGFLVVAPPKPAFVTAGVDSAASAMYLGAVSPGGISAIYDVPNVPNLGPAAPVGNAGYDAYGALPTTLGGVTVTFDGVPAPLFFVYGAQINLQVPFEVAGKTSTQVVVSYLGSASDPITVPVVAAQPAFFMLSATDPFAANADYGTNPKPNSATNPAARGSVLSVYGTGVGKVSYDVPTGVGAPGPAAGFTGGYNCSLGPNTFSVPFAGWTPTSVGLAQWSFVIPADAPTGAVNFKCTNTVSGYSTQTATVYIK
jgi:uncharacterized protein (TIGR03437 family)